MIQSKIRASCCVDWLDTRYPLFSKAEAAHYCNVLKDITSSSNGVPGDQLHKRKKIPRHPFLRQKALNPDRFSRLGDPKDELDVYEYDLEIYRCLRKQEGKDLPSPDVFKLQTDVQPIMRSTVVDWLVDLHRKAKMHSETLYLTTYLLDWYLSKHVVSRNDLQMIACAAFLIAAKNNERDAPMTDELVQVSQRSFTVQQLIAAESRMLECVEYRVDKILPSVFLKRFLRIAEPDGQLSMLSHFILETTLMDAEFVGMMPSKVAAAAVLMALTLLRGPKQWNKFMEDNTGYKLDDLAPVVQKLIPTVNAAKRGRFMAIRRKYGTDRMYKVSATPIPAELELK